MNKAKKCGFTLIELIISIALLAILISVSIVGYKKYIDNTKQTILNIEVNNYVGALAEYNNKYVASEFNGSFEEYCESLGYDISGLIEIKSIKSSSTTLSIFKLNKKIENGFLLMLEDNTLYIYSNKTGIRTIKLGEEQLIITQRNTDGSCYTITDISSKETFLDCKELILLVESTLLSNIVYNFDIIQQNELIIDSTIIDTNLSFISNMDDTCLVSTNSTAGLSSVVIPKYYTDANQNKLEVIGIANSAFQNNLNLEYIYFSSSIKSIGDYAFDSTKLKWVSIPGNIETIGKYAFNNCSSISTVWLQSGVKTISEYAFANCLIKNMFIPDTVDYILENAFYISGSVKIRNLYIESDGYKENWFYNETNIIGVSAARCLNSTEINGIAYGKTGTLTSASGINPLLKEMAILESYDEEISNIMINNYAFFGLHLLEKIDLPDNIININTYSFSNCTSLKSVIIPDGIETIYAMAFRDCKSLETIVIPNSVTVIQTYAFYGCESLETITIPNSVRTIGTSVFRSCTKLKTIIIPNSVITIEDSMFQDCKSLEAIVIPDSINSIKTSAFRNCSSLEVITIPDSVTSIGNYIFFDCESLKSITISKNITSISAGAFNNCKSLEAIIIPDSVTSIQTQAFYGCESLETIKIPDNVSVIGNKVFQDCKSLETVVIPNSVTSIGDEAFRSCLSLKSIIIPDGVTNIPSYAFSDCSSLETISIPNSVTTIGTNAFSRCTKLTIYTEKLDFAELESLGRPIIWGVTLDITRTYVSSFHYKIDITNPTATNGIKAPYRSGYTFLGWCLDSDCTGCSNLIPASIINTKPKGSTYYTVWKQD